MNEAQNKRSEREAPTSPPFELSDDLVEQLASLPEAERTRYIEALLGRPAPTERSSAPRKTGKCPCPKLDGGTNH